MKVPIFFLTATVSVRLLTTSGEVKITSQWSLNFQFRGHSTITPTLGLFLFVEFDNLQYFVSITFSVKLSRPILCESVKNVLINF